MQRLRTYLLAITLLWAQLAGAVHAVGHVHDGNDGDPGHPVCEWCVAFGSVQHGAATTHPPLVWGTAAPSPDPTLGLTAPQAPAAHPYAIRAPPSKPV